MSAKRSAIEMLQEIDADELLEREGGTAYEISFKDHEQNEDLNQYPSISNSSLSLERNSQDDDLNEVVKGVKRSSYNLDDSVNSNSGASFSCLNGSIREQDPVKSKIGSRLKEIKEEQTMPQQAQMKLFNQSIFSSRLKNNNLSNNQVQTPEKCSSEAVNYNQSFYMTEKEPAPVPKQKPKQQIKKQQSMTVNFISKGYFLQLKQLSIEVNKSSLSDLYHELFKKEIFVPRFNYQRLQEWLSSKENNKYQLDCDVHMNFKVYLERYIRYLNQFCGAQLASVFRNVQEIQQGKNQKKSSNQGFSFFHLDFHSLLENIKSMMNSSKYQILRKTLLSKIKSLKAVLRQKQEWKMGVQQQKTINQTIDYTWKDLAQIQLLRNFQQTEEYCSKQIDNSPELKFKEIWTKYRQSNRKEKTKIVTKVDSIHL